LQTGAGGDTLLGTDTNGAGGWSITTMIPTNIPRGTYTYHAQATDSAGQVSTPVSTSGITATWQAQASYNGVSSVYAKTGTADGRSLAGSSSWTNYTFKALVNLKNLNGGICLLGRVQDATHYYQLEIKKNSAGQVNWWI